MVKLTIVGRVKDGLPLAQGVRYLVDNFSSNYNQQAEFILKEISRGALPLPKMTIRVDHHSFKYPFPFTKKIIFFLFYRVSKDFTLIDSNRNLSVSDSAN